MNKKKRRLIALCVIAILSLFIVGLALFGIIPIGRQDEEYELSLDRNIRIIQTNYDTKIYLYGKNIDFEHSLQYQKVNSVAEAVHAEKGEYTVIVVNNLKQEKDLSEEECEMLAEFAGIRGQAIIYLGENAPRNYFMPSGTGAVAVGSLGSMFYCLNDHMIECSGIWDNEAEGYADMYNYNISLLITEAIVSYIKDMNGNNQW